jgi:hypothetical protein
MLRGGKLEDGILLLSADIMIRNINVKWCFMLIYGHADHAKTEEFLGELEAEVAAASSRWWRAATST